MFFMSCKKTDDVMLGDITLLYAVLKQSDIHFIGNKYENNANKPYYWDGLPHFLEKNGYDDGYTTALAYENGISYIAGHLENSGNLMSVYWSTDGNFIELSSDFVEYDIAVKNGNTYIGGCKKDYINNTSTPGYFLNEKWYALKNIGTGNTGCVYSILPTADSVLAGGYSNDGSGYSKPVYWHKDVINELPTAYFSGSVSSIFLYGNAIYAAGTNDAAGLGYWKNNTWISIDGNRDESVDSMYVSADKVYLLAGFAYWENRTRNALHVGDFWNTEMKTLLLHGDDVYVGGIGEWSTGDMRAGFWKNTEGFYVFSKRDSFSNLNDMIIVE